MPEFELPVWYAPGRRYLPGIKFFQFSGNIADVHLFTLMQHPQLPTEMKMKLQTLATVLFASTILAACNSMPSRPAIMTNDVVTGKNGMTLYVFDNDVAGSGKSTCNGPCAENWPPLTASDFAVESEGGSSDLTLITRDNGKKQWALKGKPLYFWIKDQKPGDKTGDGVKGVWHAARP